MLLWPHVRRLAQVRLFEFLKELEPVPGAQIQTGQVDHTPPDLKMEAIRGEGDPDVRESGMSENECACVVALADTRAHVHAWNSTLMLTVADRDARKEHVSERYAERDADRTDGSAHPKDVDMTA